MRSECLEGKTTANISTCPPKMKTTPKKDMMSDATDCFPLQMVTVTSKRVYSQHNLGGDQLYICSFWFLLFYILSVL